MVKRVLRRYGYPPDKQEQATRTVLEQTELLSAAWGLELPEEAAEVVDYPDGQAPRAALLAVAERHDAATVP